jgi:hypothetical protein
MINKIKQYRTVHKQALSKLRFGLWAWNQILKKPSSSWRLLTFIRAAVLGDDCHWIAGMKNGTNVRTQHFAWLNSSRHSLGDISAGHHRWTAHVTFVMRASAALWTVTVLSPSECKCPTKKDCTFFHWSTGERVDDVIMHERLNYSTATSKSNQIRDDIHDSGWFNCLTLKAKMNVTTELAAMQQCRRSFFLKRMAIMLRYMGVNHGGGDGARIP